MRYNQPHIYGQFIEVLETRLLLSVPSFTASTSVLSASRYQIAGVAVNSTAYFAGGIGGNHPILEPDDTVDVYDARSDHWSSMKMPIPGIGHAFSFSNDLVFIGAQNVGTGIPVTYSTEVFAPMTGQWKIQRTPDLAGGVPTQVGHFVIYAGANGHVEIYDAARGRWSRAHLRDLLTRNGAVTGEKAYFSTGKMNDSVQVFNGHTGQWSIETVPGAANSKLIGLGVHLLLAHTVPAPRPAIDRVIDLLQIYDPMTKQLVSKGGLSQPRAIEDQGGTIATVGTRAFFIGGTYFEMTGAAHESSAVDIYDGTTGTWSIGMQAPPGKVVENFLKIGNKVLFPPAANGHLVGAIYDTKGNAWSTATFSVNRDEFAMTVVNYKAIFAGGRSPAPDVNLFRPVNTVDIFTDTAPSPVLSGGLTGAPGHGDHLTVINTGDADLPAGYTIQLYATPDRTLGGAILVGSRTVSSRLAAGSSPFSIRTVMPKDMPAGNYHLLAAVQDSSGNITPIAAEDEVFSVRGSHITRADRHPQKHA